MKTWGFPDDAVIKNPPANAGDSRHGFDPWVGKICWSRKWQPTPVFLPGKCHGQRSLAGYSSWGCKDSDMIEHTHAHTYTHTHTHTMKIQVLYLLKKIHAVQACIVRGATVYNI